MGKRRSPEDQSDQPETLQSDQAVEDAEETPSSSDEDAGASLPLDMLLQMEQDTEKDSTDEGGGDFASLLASLQDHETDKARADGESDDDQELSQMLSLMTSHDPGLAEAGETEANGETSEDEKALLEALPEGTEMLLDPEPSSGEAGEVAEEENAAAADVKLASVIGDERLEEEDKEDASSIQTADADLEAGDLVSDAIEDYDITDTADALLSTIGLDHDLDPLAPSVPEGAAQDDDTPDEDLLDDRILDDFQKLREDLGHPAEPAQLASAGPHGSPETCARILCIDDDPDNSALFRGILDSEDYAFTDVEGGEEALETLREGEVDLILLNLDIATQDGFELIEEAASDVTLSQVPILVNSVSTDHVEKALRLGASDYFIRPMSVIDVKFQIPIKVRNLLKIRKSERMMAMVGAVHDSDLMAAPAVENEPDAGKEGDALTEDRLQAEGLPVALENDEPGPSPEGLLSGPQKDEPLEELFGEEDQEEAGTGQEDDDLTALFDDDTKAKKEDEESSDDSLESLFDEHDEEETEAGTGQEDASQEEDLDTNSSEQTERTAGLAAAGVAIGAAALRSGQNQEVTSSERSAAEIIGKPLQKSHATIWRSSSLARGEQERTLQERRREAPRKSGRRRFLYAACALLLVGVGIWALWAKQRLRETGEVSSIVPSAMKTESPEVAENAPETSAGAETRPRLEVQTPAETLSDAPLRKTDDFEEARKRASVPSSGERRLAETRAQIRTTVDAVASAGGQWWAPWKVLNASGESIREVVNERRREDILEAFGVTETRVEKNLKHQSIVNFLSRRGFKIKGKKASDLSAREMFEVLSMREIKTKDKVVAILSALKEKAEAARAQRAARMKAASPRTALRIEAQDLAPAIRNGLAWERPGGENRRAGDRVGQPVKDTVYRQPASDG